MMKNMFLMNFNIKLDKPYFFLPLYYYLFFAFDFGNKGTSFPKDLLFLAHLPPPPSPPHTHAKKKKREKMQLKNACIMNE